MRVETIGNATLYLGDCRDILPTLPRVDAVITDPPYGITANSWDININPYILWDIQAPLYAINSSQPFTSKLVVSKLDWFRHEWIWIKDRGSNFANTVREPMKEHESILIFAKDEWVYNKQMQRRSGTGLDRVSYSFQNKAGSENYREFNREGRREGENLRVPSSWQFFKRENGLHPTQKPLALVEYLIRTYTNDGFTILDPFMGSGTTGAACANIGRSFIGIELDSQYFDIACRRIEDAQRQARLFS